MSRTGRKHSGTGIYHVMLRGVNRQGVFEEPEDYREGWNQTCPYDSQRKNHCQYKANDYH